jgi:sulfate/thiosulfate transport system permease protein
MSTRAGPRRVGAGPRSRALVLAFVFASTLVFILAPLAVIFYEALRVGAAAFARNLAQPDTLHAIGLTVLVALIAVPINALFGIAAAWAVTKFQFRGKTVLIALIELPFSVSPIVAGVAYLFVYGAQGLLGPFLQDNGIKIMFALPAIVLASMFVTAPFVARELIALMQTQGTDNEEAALTLGARPLTMLRRVTLPNVRWALLYGVLLCNARVMGEFGAVSVVSGNIRGETNTLPLQIQLLYQDYNTAGAFAAATVLAAIALLTLGAKLVVERFDPDAAKAHAAH